MRSTPDSAAEDLRWTWAATGFAVGCAVVLMLPALHLVLAAAALGLAGLAVFHLAGHRVAGARLASVGLGMLIPAAAVAVVHGVNSF